MPVTMVELRLHIRETSQDISEELGLVSYAGGAMLQVVSECPPASLGWYSKCNLQKPISMSNYAIINLFTENAISDSF